MCDSNFKILEGKIISSIEGMKVGSEEIILTLNTGEKFKISHDHDCCKSVRVEGLYGDISDLLNMEIIVANETSSNSHGSTGVDLTWTYYQLGTMKGVVTIQWFGVSNGYWSDRVELKKY